MTRRQRRQKRRALLLRAAIVAGGIALAMIAAPQLAHNAGAQSCGGWHGTVAAATPQQFAAVMSAAEAGNPQAMVEVGQMYRDGLGVERDLVKAHAWLRLAAYRGVSIGGAQRALAACLSDEQIHLSDAQVLAFLQQDEDE